MARGRSLEFLKALRKKYGLGEYASQRSAKPSIRSPGNSKPSPAKKRTAPTKRRSRRRVRGLYPSRSSQLFSTRGLGIGLSPQPMGPAPRTHKAPA